MPNSLFKNDTINIKEIAYSIPLYSLETQEKVKVIKNKNDFGKLDWNPKFKLGNISPNSKDKIADMRFDLIQKAEYQYVKDPWSCSKKQWKKVNVYIDYQKGYALFRYKGIKYRVDLIPIID